MCGIVGFLGSEEIKLDAFLIEGLKRLEYRGYDSVGVTFRQSEKLELVKTKGMVSDLLAMHPALEKIATTSAIGHTRWATHGEPSEANAHPHLSFDGNIVLVHNGTIENYLELFAILRKENPSVNVSDENDTRILTHFIAHRLKDKPLSLESLNSILKEVKGSYALVIMDLRVPHQLFTARNKSPLAIGRTKEGVCLVASDVLAFAGIAEMYMDVEDHSITVLEIGKDPVVFSQTEQKTISPEFKQMTLEVNEISKQGFEDYMIKEIFEQKDIFHLATELRLKEKGIEIEELKPATKDKLKKTRKCSFFACGTSYHASLLGAHFIEKNCQVQTIVNIASEYNTPYYFHDETECAFFVSQSGETADTLSALKKIKEQGVYTIAICNVMGSSLTKEADDAIYIHAGPEISVASTKAFTSQVFTLRMLMHFINQVKKGENQESVFRHEIQNIKEYIEGIYQFNENMKPIANLVQNSSNLLYLGRGDSFSIALEGALKMKEISYIFCFALPAGEMKHGTIALVDEGMYTIFVEFYKENYDKLQISIKEVLARKGKVLLFTADDFPVDVFKNPNLIPFLIPVDTEFKMMLGVSVLLQLIAYHVAKAKGNNVDKPRNLAKSVTVE